MNKLEKQANKVSVSSEKVTVDFHYFIQLAVQKKITWSTLAFFMIDLAPTLEKSKKVIEELVQELEKWVTKMETDSNHDETNAFHKTDMKSLSNVLIQEEKGNNEEPEETDEYFENSEDESIIDDPEVLSYEPQEEMLDESKLEIQSELSQSGETSMAVNFPTNEFYEFIGDNETPNSVFSNDDEDELSTVETSSDVNNEKRFCIEQQNDKTLTNFDSEKKYQCNFCNKCFIRKSDKRRHERIHTGEKPYQCKVCQKAFSQPHHLKIHDRIHTGDKPFECKFCQKQFRDKSTMNRHERIHTGEKPFQC